MLAKHRRLSAFVLVFLPLMEVSAMLYQPAPPHAMWDTWLFQDGDEFHLFFLQSEPGVTWNTLGRAVSKDLVHWTPLPPIPTKGPEGAWDFAPTLTGCTVTFQGRYYTFYGSSTQGQKIGVMVSDDLRTWSKHPGNPTLTITPPHYGGTDWRDLCSVYDPAEKRWHGYVCAQTAFRGGGEPNLPTLKDKTLVAWVTLANLAQRGGSVLTLNYGREAGDVFDAIVFGERKPAAWMAGSNYFERTQKDQAAYPVETAGPGTLIQVAIAYRGNQVTAYRNGEQVADYDAGAQQAFGDGAAVVMGLRHLGCGAGPRFFAGTIDEARIYGTALDQAAIRGLKPNQPAGPKPIGQWTFEDGTARDAMGTFPEGKLFGGARIEGGRLHLDGEGAYLATPSKPTGRGGCVPCVAHVVSKDLVTWEFLPHVFESSEFVDMEVPDYFELGGRHYLIFSSARSRKDTSGRTNASGCYYVVGDRREGPYRVPERPLLLGSGRGRFDNYVARTIPFGDTRLLYQHTVGGPVTWGTPKLVRQHPDGSLWLQYWPGLDKLVTKSLLDGTAKLDTGERAGPGTWTVEGGSVTGHSPDKASVLWLPVTAADTMITLDLDAANAGRAGVVWRWDGKKGAGMTIDRKARTVAVVTAAPQADGIGTTLVDDVEGVAMPDGPQHLRIVVRAHRAEVYVNDCWLLGVSLTDSPASGKIGLLVEGGAAAFSRLCIAELEALKPSSPE